MHFDRISEIIFAGLPLAVADAGNSIGDSSARIEIAQPGTNGDVRDHTIVVRGRPPGAVLGDFAIEMELSGDDIRALQSRTIAELLDSLGPQTGTGRGRDGDPVVLLNGRRITDRSEVDRLPSEAVVRVEVLGPDVATHFGYRPDRKVINIVVKQNFRATTLSVARAEATAGGWQQSEGEANFVRIAGPNRFSITASVARNNQLTEAERGIGIPDSALDGLVTSGDMELIGTEPEFRTLVPRSTRAELGASYSRPVVGSTTMTLSGRFSAEKKDSQLGLVSVDLKIPSNRLFVPDPASGFRLRRLVEEYSPLARINRNRTVAAGFTLDGELARLTWSVSAKWNHFRAKAFTDDRPDPSPLQQEIDAGSPGLDPFGPLPLQLLRRDRRQLARFRSDRIDLSASAQGPVLDIPAGAVTANFSMGAVANRIASLVRTGSSESSVTLSRNSVVGSAGINLPLASRNTGALGDFSVNAGLEVQHHSDFGSLTTLSYGLNWRPHGRTTLRLTMINDHSVPPMQTLGNPLTFTPRLRVHDFATDEDIEILLIEGGNRDLRAARRKSLEATFSYRLLTGKRSLSFSIEFRDVSVRDRIGSVSGAVATFQATFPERYIRKADGRLDVIDARPVNFAREETRHLRWGAQFSLPLGAAASNGGPAVAGNSGRPSTRIVGSLFHDWQLRNRLTLREGVLPLDLNGEDLFGYPGNWPEHDVQFQLGLYSGGIGASATARWRSASRLRDRGGPASARSGTLSFSDVLLAGLVVSFDLGELGMRGENCRWFKGATLSVSVTNLLNRRLDVRDGNGRHPFSYQPAYFDPVGRSVAVGLRKQF